MAPSRKRRLRKTGLYTMIMKEGEKLCTLLFSVSGSGPAVAGGEPVLEPVLPGQLFHVRLQTGPRVTSEKAPTGKFCSVFEIFV